MSTIKLTTSVRFAQEWALVALVHQIETIDARDTKYCPIEIAYLKNTTENKGIQFSGFCKGKKFTITCSVLAVNEPNELCPQVSWSLLGVQVTYNNVEYTLIDPRNIPGFEDCIFPE